MKNMKRRSVTNKKTNKTKPVERFTNDKEIMITSIHGLFQPVFEAIFKFNPWSMVPYDHDITGA